MATSVWMMVRLSTPPPQPPPPPRDEPVAMFGTDSGLARTPLLPFIILEDRTYEDEIDDDNNDEDAAARAWGADSIACASGRRGCMDLWVSENNYGVSQHVTVHSHEYLHVPAIMICTEAARSTAILLQFDQYIKLN